MLPKGLKLFMQGHSNQRVANRKIKLRNSPNIKAESESHQSIWGVHREADVNSLPAQAS